MKTSLVLSPLALGLLTSAAFAGSAQLSEREIRADIEFARGLAEDWQFVEMAEGVLDEIELGSASDALRSDVGLTRCRVYASSARREREDTRKQELYEQAITAYADFIDDNRGADEAERELVDVANAYGQDLFRLYEQAIGEEAESLKEKIADTLTDAIRRTQDLANKILSDIDYARENNGSVTALEREYYLMMLNRGQAHLTIAKVSDVGTFDYEQAAEAMFDIMDRAGDASYWGLLASSRLGEVYAAQGEYVDASDFLQYVIESTVPIDPEVRSAEGGFDDFDSAAKEGNWRFVDTATGPLVEAFAAQGEIAEACRWGLHFVNVIDEYGFQMTRPNGYVSMLAVAQTLLDSGGFVGGESGSYSWYQTREEMTADGHRGRRRTRSTLDLALQLSQQVNRENRGNILQLYSQRVISDIINRGVAVDPEVLFEAAQGAYFEQRFPDAVEGFKRVLAVLETSDDITRTTLGPQTFYYIGRSLQKDGRDLEAAMAFRRGLDDRWVGDPKHDPENAKQYHNTIRKLRTRAPGDALLESSFREAQDLVLRFQSGEQSAGDILYSQAKRAYDEKDYEDARSKFIEVPKGSKEYEKALVYAAVSLNKLGDADQALADITEYLEVYVADPVNAPTDEIRVTNRKSAMGLARYYGGLIHFNRAEKGQAGYEPVIEWLDGYAKEFPGQKSFAPKAIYMVLKAYLVAEDFDAAKARLDELIETFPTSTWTGHAALALYKVYDERRGDSGDADLTRRMAETLKLFNKLGGSPKLSYLYNESKLWLELGEWAEAERVLSKTVDAFGDSSDTKTQDTLRKSTRPDLAHAMLEQQKVREAFDLLTDLMEGVERPSRGLATDYARAVTGWVTGTGRDISIVAGVGGDAETFQRTVELVDQLADASEKWETPWYELKFQLAYGYYQWGQTDGKQLQIAKGIIKGLESDMGDAQLMPIQEAAGGDDTLRRRFLWLRDKIK